MVTARKGDTLASLAARHGVTAANMASWNKLHIVASLKAGQSLAVYVPSQAARPLPKVLASGPSSRAHKAPASRKKKR
jgi:membrane-bound lytic murein transglycosylase D